MDNIKVVVLNTKDELLSFPLNQSVVLEFSESIEDSQLQSCICLIRNLNGKGLFNISDKYNQSIGYVREKFDLEPVDIKIISTTPSFKVEIKPLNTLSPGFDYTLFIDKKLSSEFLVIDKLISKSKSNIKVIVKNASDVSHTVEIISNPTLTSSSNIIKILFQSPTQSKVEVINLKDKKNVTFEDIVYEFQDTVYVLGEKFEIISTTAIALESSLFITLHASLTESIKPIKGIDDSTRIGYEDILEYYSNNSTTVVEEEVEIVYTGYDTFLIVLPSEYQSIDIDLDNISFTTNEAFGNYLLSMYELYDNLKQYSLIATAVDNKTLKVTVEEL